MTKYIRSFKRDHTATYRKINQLLGYDKQHILSAADMTAAMALADINILSLETANAQTCPPPVFVLYEYRWRYGDEPSQTKWNRAGYYYIPRSRISPGEVFIVNENGEKQEIPLDVEESIMLGIMDLVISTRDTLHESTGVSRHGRL